MGLDPVKVIRSGYQIRVFGGVLVVSPLRLQPAALMRAEWTADTTPGLGMVNGNVLILDSSESWSISRLGFPTHWLRILLTISPRLISALCSLHVRMYPYPLTTSQTILTALSQFTSPLLTFFKLTLTTHPPTLLSTRSTPSFPSTAI